MPLTILDPNTALIVIDLRDSVYTGNHLAAPRRGKTFPMLYSCASSWKEGALHS